MKHDEASPSRRSGAIDLLRGLLILYVVGYLHLGGYIGDGERHVSWWTVTITNVVLATFTFLSGYLLGVWKGGATPRDLGRFYWRRLIRIYPLYLLALAAFVLLWLVDAHTAIKGAFAISMFFPEPPMTLWYVTMIIVCYLFAPALSIPSPRGGVAAAVVLWLSMLLFNFTVHEIDPRMLTQFAAFAAGVSYRRFDLPAPAKLPVGRLSAAFVLALALAIVTVRMPLGGAIAAMPSVIFGPVLLFAVAEQYFPASSANRSVAFFGYISFSVYLFHRIVFQLIHRWLWPSTEGAQVAVLLMVGLPCVVLLATLIQTGYDRLLTALFRERTATSLSTPRAM